MWLCTVGLSALLPVPNVFAAPTATAADGTAAETASKPATMPLHIAGHFLLSGSGARNFAWQVNGCLQHCCDTHTQPMDSLGCNQNPAVQLKPTLEMHPAVLSSYSCIMLKPAFHILRELRQTTLLHASTLSCWPVCAPPGARPSARCWTPGPPTCMPSCHRRRRCWRQPQLALTLFWPSR
jgi:hypothetical protein